MAIGRISGPLLKDNLTRNGVNLAVETDLLYLLVSNSDRTTHNVGIKTTNPAYPLDVNGAAGIAGNLNFTGTGNRITGDMTNGTQANRLAFQTSTANSATAITAIPSGTGTQSSINLFDNSDPTNAGTLNLLSNATEKSVRAQITGTGTYLPMTFYTGGSERMRLDTSGNVGIGTNSPANKFEVFGNNARNTVRASTTAGDVFVEAQSFDYWSTPTYAGTAIRQYGSTATGTTAGLSNANLGVLQFQNVGFGLITVGNTSLVLATNSTERMRIDTSGNLGVGTTSPSYMLDVAGTERSYGFTSTAVGIPATPTASLTTGGSLPTSTTYFFKIVAIDGLGGATVPSAESTVVTTTGATLSITVSWTATIGAKSYQVWYSTTTGTKANYFTSTTNSFLFTTTTGNTAGTIPTANTTGFVGIGTSSPTSTLDVLGPIRSRGSVSPTFTLNDGTIENYLRISSSTLQLVVPSANPISFLTTNTEQVRITATGNVIMYGTGALQIPAGTAGQQPTPTAGMMRYNTTINQPEAYTGASWIPMTPPIWGRIFTMMGV